MSSDDIRSRDFYEAGAVHALDVGIEEVERLGLVERRGPEKHMFLTDEGYRAAAVLIVMLTKQAKEAGKITEKEEEAAVIVGRFALTKAVPPIVADGQHR